VEHGTIHRVRPDVRRRVDRLVERGSSRRRCAHAGAPAGLALGDFAAEWRIPSLQKTYARLARSVRLIQLDGRGSGHSQRDVTDLSLEAMLRDVDAVVDAARLERFAILGFDNSVTHAIACAAEHRERVTHLSLFGGALRGWIPRLLCPR